MFREVFSHSKQFTIIGQKIKNYLGPMGKTELKKAAVKKVCNFKIGLKEGALLQKM